MKVFIICLLLFFSVSSVYGFSGERDLQEIQAQTEDGVVLKGFHLKNSGKKRILLAHGFAENTRIFRELAYELHDAGWDVYMFNFRGHGNGEQKSRHPLESQGKIEGLYSFDNWVTQDVPAILKTVLRSSQEKVTLLGHSLGGVALRAFLSGVRQSKTGRIYQTSSLREIERYSSQVETLHTVGSPTRFSDSPSLKFNLWKKLPEVIQKIGMTLYPMKKETTADSQGVLLLEKAFEVFHRAMWISGSYNGLVGKGFDPKSFEMARVFRKAFTYDVPLDLVRDVNLWVQDGFTTRNGVSYQRLALPGSLRFVQTIALQDGLAPAKAVLNDTRTFRFHHTPEIVLMRDHQHLDMIAGQSGADRIYSIIEEKNQGEVFSFPDLQRRTLILPQRCSLFFAI